MVLRVEVVSGVCKSGFGVAGIVKSVGDFFRDCRKTLEIAILWSFSVCKFLIFNDS